MCRVLFHSYTTKQRFRRKFLFTLFHNILFHSSPSPSNELVFTASDKIAIGDSYPVIQGGNLLVMIVVKSDQSNALCSAASGSSRKKRSITLGSLEFAIPQSVLQDILNDASV